jgi:branched-subunit amino acid aminotransferase/4-amino-4-deoxychorismate lyase
MVELDGEPLAAAGAAELRSLALTNYGHFTTMRVDDGRVRGLPLHLDRLARDCRTVFGTDLDTGRVRDLARRAAPATGSVVLRVTVFDPALDVGHIGGDARPRVLVTSRPAAPGPLPPLRVGSAAFVRDLPEVKSTGLFGALWHRRAAQRAGFDDVVFTDDDAYVSEGTTWNIGFVRDDEVVWPSADCLAGTTMELLKRLHTCSVAPVRLADLASVEAAFVTNAAIGVRAVAGVDGTGLPGTHPVIDLLAGKYAACPGDPL